MALYNVDQTASPASAFTKKLSEEDFATYVTIAESVLGLTAPPLTEPTAVARLQIAILLQVNFMAQYGTDPYIKASEGMSSQATSSVVWRDRYIDPRPLSIVAAVIPKSTAWTGADKGSQSHRKNDVSPSMTAYEPNVERFRW